MSDTPTNASELYNALVEINEDEFVCNDTWSELCEGAVDEFAAHAPEAFAAWAKQIIESYEED